MRHHDVKRLAAAVQRHADVVRIALVAKGFPNGPPQAEQSSEVLWQKELLGTDGIWSKRTGTDESDVFVSGVSSPLILVDDSLDSNKVVQRDFVEIRRRTSGNVPFIDDDVRPAVADGKGPFVLDGPVVVGEDVSDYVECTPDTGKIRAGRPQVAYGRNRQSFAVRSKRRNQYECKQTENKMLHLPDYTTTNWRLPVPPNGGMDF